MEKNSALLDEIDTRRRRARRLRDQPGWLTALAFGVALSAVSVDAALGDDGYAVAVGAVTAAWLVAGVATLLHRRRFGRTHAFPPQSAFSWALSLSMFLGYLAFSQVHGDAGTAGQIAVGVVGNAAFGLLFRIRFLLYVSVIVALGGVLLFTYPAGAWISTALLGVGWLVAGALSLRASSRPSMPAPSPQP